jgi:NADPH2:quinone reductase
MRAIGIEAFGGPEALTVLDAPDPAPGPGEVRVRLSHAGVNFIDVYMRSGAYRRSDTYKTPLPMVLGMEGVGRVDAVGAGVDGIRPGERVAWCIHRGAYAEAAVVPAWKLVPVPDDVADETACALQLQGCTAHYLTHSAFALGPRHSCLLHAGAGGVGQLVIQLAKAAGATVITTVGSAEKAGIARARGADHVILYREEDFRERVMEITGGEGVDVVYDSVGRDTIDRSIRSLKRRGLIVNYGGSSGLVESVSPLDLAEAGSVFFTRPHLADYMRDAAEIRSRTDALFKFYAGGKLEVAVDRVLPLAAAAEAHRIIEGRQTRGKLLLAV